MKPSIDQALFRAKQYKNAGDVARAVEIYEDLLRKHKNNKKLQARVLALINAVRPNIGNKQPSWRDHHQQLVDMYVAGQFPPLIEKLRALTKSHPKAFELWNMLGMALEGNHRISDATSAFQQAASLSPGNADVLLNFASNLSKVGDTATLRGVLLALLEADSQKRSTFNSAGVLLYQHNAMQEAEIAFRRALDLDPSYADAYNNLGIVMSAQSRHVAAIKNFRSALAAAPNAPEAYNNLGNALRRSGEFAESVSYFEQAIALKPNYKDAFFNLGLALHDMEKYDAAINQFTAALEIDPHSPKTYDSLATALQSAGRFSESKRHYEKALEQDQNFYQAHNNLGVLLQNNGDINGALTHLNRAIQLSPTYSDALNNLGTALLETGAIEKAATAFTNAIKYDPRHFGAIKNLAAMRGSDVDEDLLLITKSLYGDADLAVGDKAKLGYALYSLHKKKQEYDEAFLYLREANQARKQSMNYDFQQDAELYAERLQRPLSHGPLAASLFAPAPGIPIFICGMPRSGTTLIEQILSCHSEISPGGELRHIGAICRDNKSLNFDDEELLQAFRNKYFQACPTSLYGTEYFTDKMPHNFLYIPEIINAFPEAKILHVFRSPEATCWSNFENSFTVNGLGYSYDLDDLVPYQNLYVELMSRYSAFYKDRICHVDYDSLTIRQEPAIRDLFDALKIPFEETALQPHLNKRHVATASNQQIREPIYTGSSEQWRKFEGHTADYFARLERFKPPH